MTESGDQERILVPISAIEHWSYCPRQCGLIHLEQTFDENLYTVRGRLAHERVDEEDSAVTGEVTVMRSLPLWSDRLGLIGRADVVELRTTGPYPVEYKVGPPVGRHAALQLCAQALCLEEMTGSAVNRGATLHVATRRRHVVSFDAAMRREVVAIVDAIRSMLGDQVLPPPVADRRCRQCSLFDSCQPEAMAAIPLRSAWDAWLLRPPESES